MIHKKNTIIKYTDNSYWKSYSDMMAALLLMFILIMSTIMLQSFNATAQHEEQIAQNDKQLGINPEIVNALKRELSEFQVSIDDKTGDIKFKSDILFDYDMDVLKPEGTDFLNTFMPKYLNVILSEKYIPYIAEIIIEGHTDSSGGYMYNLKLSQNRAVSVAEFCVGNVVGEEQQEQLKKIMTVTGKATSNPVYNENGDIDDDKSRRVELKFRLKDDDSIADFNIN